MERRFFACFTITALVLASLVGATNWYVDPFARRAALHDGFERDPAYTLNRRLFKLIAFERWLADHDGEPPALIIGDSTANQIDAEQMSRLTGRPWYSLAFGGAGLTETIELAKHVLERRFPVREIVWAVPFARLIGGVPSDMPRSIAMAAAPWRHTFTFEALHASFLVMRATWLGIGFEDPKLDTGGQDIVTYQLSRARTEMAGRPWPEEELAALSTTIAQARLRGLRVTLLSPPLHPRMADLFANGFRSRHARYRSFLEEHCRLDFNDPAQRRDWPPEFFADSSHLAQAYKPRLAQALAQALKTPCTRSQTAGR